VVGFCDHVNELSVSMKKAGYCLASLVTNSFSKNILQQGMSK
jgi:hypothetical protein